LSKKNYRGRAAVGRSSKVGVGVSIGVGVGVEVGIAVGIGVMLGVGPNRLPNRPLDTNSRITIMIRRMAIIIMAQKLVSDI